MVQAFYGRNAGHLPVGSASKRLARPGSAAVPSPVSKPQPIPASHVLNRRAHVTGMVRGISPEQARFPTVRRSTPERECPNKRHSGPGATRVQFFPAIFFGVLKMLDRAAIIALIGRIRRRYPQG